MKKFDRNTTNGEARRSTYELVLMLVKLDLSMVDFNDFGFAGFSHWVDNGYTNYNEVKRLYGNHHIVKGKS